MQLIERKQNEIHVSEWATKKTGKLKVVLSNTEETKANARLRSISMIPQEKIPAARRRSSHFEIASDFFITSDEFQEKDKTSVLVNLPSSIYGLVVCVSVSKTNFDMNAMFFPIMAVTWLAQGVLLYKIWIELPPAHDAPLCFTSDFLLLAVLFVFLIGAIVPIQDAILEMRVAYNSTERFRKTEIFGRPYYKYVKLTGATDRSILARALLFITIACEITIWISVVVVGCAYILSQQGAGSIVQGAVAITFINEVDQMVFDLVLPGKLTLKLP